MLVYKDTGPVPGETFEQKVARLKALSAARNNALKKVVKRLRRLK